MDFDAAAQGMPHYSLHVTAPRSAVWPQIGSARSPFGDWNDLIIQYLSVKDAVRFSATCRGALRSVFARGATWRDIYAEQFLTMNITPLTYEKLPIPLHFPRRCPSKAVKPLLDAIQQLAVTAESLETITTEDVEEVIQHGLMCLTTNTHAMAERAPVLQYLKWCCWDIGEGEFEDLHLDERPRLFLPDLEDDILVPLLNAAHPDNTPGVDGGPRQGSGPDHVRNHARCMSAHKPPFPTWPTIAIDPTPQLDTHPGCQWLTRHQAIVRCRIIQLELQRWMEDMAQAKATEGSETEVNIWRTAGYLNQARLWRLQYSGIPIRMNDTDDVDREQTELRSQLESAELANLFAGDSARYLAKHHEYRTSPYLVPACQRIPCRMTMAGAGMVQRAMTQGTLSFNDSVLPLLHVVICRLTAVLPPVAVAWNVRYRVKPALYHMLPKQPEHAVVMARIIDHLFELAGIPNPDLPLDAD
eukprot:NODE_928_length_1552_cov_51.575439_g917_i0.p1 GENE.NODE_928_length_1552_cov_51.575439_g917_i0~~NODE_928_length_1552_cov_51.575439_g917_i0.p1  ORF type:complete len:471 (+),score=63.80 NODE_928_length_1552_cov_51.575439_g917_i0:79-1491(+)